MTGTGRYSPLLSECRELWGGTHPSRNHSQHLSLCAKRASVAAALTVTFYSAWRRGGQTSLGAVHKGQLSSLLAVTGTEPREQLELCQGRV